MKAKTVFAQGLRRSGTTVLYDLMLHEGYFTCFYEPLAWGRPTLGGGSGIHKEADLFANVREQRETFLEEHPEWLVRCPDFRESNFFNHGAPRLPEVEFEPSLPAHCNDYLRHLTRAAPATFLKFTRMHSKIACLRDIEPDAKLIHIVRDPRHVVGSYIFGKGGVHREKFHNAKQFFNCATGKGGGSSRHFASILLKSPEYRDLGVCEDFVKILVVWNYHFLRTHTAGLRCFGDSYRLFRHEDLLQNPEKSLDELGEFLGVPFKEKTLLWAKDTLRPPASPFAGDDRRWGDGFRRIGMQKALSESGYLECLSLL